MVEITRENAWSLVRDDAKIGERLRTWSVKRGDLDTWFTVTEIHDDHLFVIADGSTRARRISDHTCSKLGNVWDEYSKGHKPRNELRGLSFHTSYVLALLNRAASK